jgi:hypothetical protein
MQHCRHGPDEEGGLPAFILACSDGVWDVLSPSDASRIALLGGVKPKNKVPTTAATEGGGRNCKDGHDWCPRLASDAVVDAAVSKRTQDNATAAVIVLSPAALHQATAAVVAAAAAAAAIEYEQTFRGKCGSCEGPVFTTQRRNKDDKGVYFHANPNDCGFGDAATVPAKTPALGLHRGR